MPKIRFAELPRPVWEHLLKRVAERKIAYDDLERLQAWAASKPVAPHGEWFKNFGSFMLCGSGEFAKTVLLRGMKPFGDEIE